MSVIGFNFTKIGAQILSKQKGKIQINNNINVREVESQEFSAEKTRKAVRVAFRYDGLYEPKVAHIQLDGDIILLLPAKEADELIKGWDEKKVPTKTLTEAMNVVLEKCNIQAIMIARDMNLPSPVPLPKVNMSAGTVTKNQLNTKAELPKSPLKSAKKTAEKK